MSEDKQAKTAQEETIKLLMHPVNRAAMEKVYGGGLARALIEGPGCETLYRVLSKEK